MEPSHTPRRLQCSDGERRRGGEEHGVAVAAEDGEGGERQLEDGTIEIGGWGREGPEGRGDEEVNRATLQRGDRGGLLCLQGIEAPSSTQEAASRRPAPARGKIFIAGKKIAFAFVLLIFFLF